MNTYKLTILLTGFLFLLACDNNYNGGNYNEQTNTHNYDSTSEAESGDLKAGINKVPVEESGNEVRDVWQKPQVVIHELGDLKDKVVADIGAGPYGFFTFRIANNTEVKKIIAIDIDKEAIQFIENTKITQTKEVKNRIETRLVEPDDPKLNEGEADIVLIVNTYVFFENPVEYLKNLKRGIAKDGKLVIIDFKKRYTPEGPPMDYRKAIGKVEQELLEAGYPDVESDDQTLDYQYIITARPGINN